MARFFIDRPVFAWVIAILIMMAGGISIFRLPVEQYPRIAPPVVTITAKYSGASAQTLEDTVAQVIEQKLNGIDGLLYINSTSDAAGQVSIRLTFDPDTNPDVAQMQVQNKLQLATSSLPEEVTRQGITVTKVADSFLQMYAFVSSDDSMSAADLCDFVGSTILDPLSRVDGVGEVSLFGAPYAMRIWLNPSKLLSYSLTPSDVINAVKAQNKQVSLGEVGGKPIRDGQQMNVTIKAQKQLTSVPEFERILLRVNPDGSAVRLRDVARVELGQESYTSSARYNGKPAAGVGIKLASDANALNTSNAVAAFIEGMRPYFDELRGAGFAPERLVAGAGTATTVVSIHERMEVYDTSRVHKAVITRPMLDGVADQLERVPLAQRERIVGLDPGRAPVIVAGMVILQTVLDLAGVDSFTVSESDILHGIILDEAAR